MATAQTTILAYGQPGGYAGQPTQVLDTQSAANNEASLAIGYGLGVKPGTLLKSMLLPTANSSTLAGVILNEMVYAPGTFGNVTSVGVTVNTIATLLTEGRCYVVVDSDTVAGNDTPAYWCFQTAGNSVIGQFRDTDNGNTVDTTKKVTFKGSPFAAPDVLTGGTTLICEAYVSISNKQ